MASLMKVRFLVSFAGWLLVVLATRDYSHNQLASLPRVSITKLYQAYCTHNWQQDLRQCSRSKNPPNDARDAGGTLQALGLK
jgi:hypothetical protein